MVFGSTIQRPIALFQNLLASIAPPDRTELLANYPNPFNPETRIPYHLAYDADVRLTIYDTKGAKVRQLDLGHQLAGYYTDRTIVEYTILKFQHPDKNEDELLELFRLSAREGNISIIPG